MKFQNNPRIHFQIKPFATEESNKFKVHTLKKLINCEFNIKIVTANGWHAIEMS